MSDHDDHPDSSTTGTLHTRREFLRSTVLGAACAWTLPAFINTTFLALNAQAEERSAVQTVTGKDAPILVVLQLAGGNDGLNTVIPYTDDAYHRARPNLRFAPDKILKLNDGLGLNPALAALKALHDEGHLAVVQGVGYPNPNRSHFRSTEIWQTASDANGFRPYGWLGSYFDNCCPGADPTVGVAIGGQSPQAFQAKQPSGVSFANPEQFRFIDRERPTQPGGGMSATEFFYRQLNAGDEEMGQADASNAKSQVRQSPVSPFAAGGSIGAIAGGSSARTTADGLSSLDFLERTALDAQLASDKILAIARHTRPLVPYPGGRLSESLSLVGRMIAGGLPTRVYYVSQGGYDTHQGQQGTHQRLMGELGASLGAFCADLKAQGNFNRVVVMTFSEFGRRVAQNASGGTDHGAAAPMFLLGGGLKGGVYGRSPSLTQLFQGDLMHTVDFRSVYATVLERWLRVPGERVLGRRFETLPMV